MQKKRRIKWIMAAALTVTAVLLLFGRACYWEPAMITVTRRLIDLNSWPPALNGFKVAVLADFHQFKPPSELARTRRIVEIANRENPDLIVLPGDFVGERFNRQQQNADPATIAELLRPLRARYGVYAVLGNHDHWHDGTEVRRALEAVGIKVLENETATLEINGKAVNLVGLPDRMTRHQSLRPDQWPAWDRPAIILSHAPDYFDELKLPGELMLAAHTHGGQVRLPWLGALVLPSQYGRKYSAQYHEAPDGRKLFITHGLGTSIFRVRLFCPPEIAILTLNHINP